MPAIGATTYTVERRQLGGGQATTVHVVRHRRDRVRLQVEMFPRPMRLEDWSARAGCREAVVGGFFLRDPHLPLGEVRRRGRRERFAAFPASYAARRPAVEVHGRRVRIARRERLPVFPRGDLLQAGPLLVEHGQVAWTTDDYEGFSAAAAQFDSDITAGREPRAALGLCGKYLVAAVCDGRRTGSDAGLTFTELAELMIDLGCREAMNLDGGGSATLLHGGRVRNRPYDGQDVPVQGGARPVLTALSFRTRRATPPGG